MKDSSVYTLTAAGCHRIVHTFSLELERFRLGLVAHVSPEEAWYVVEEGIKMFVSVFLDMSCGYQHGLYEQVNSPEICALTMFPISTVVEER